MYNYIAVSGTIGAGKTELAGILSHRLNKHLILEEFASNPFLAKFYQEQERYAFPLEISFLFERFQQLKTSFAKADIFSPGFVSDYFFDKSYLFAKHNLRDDQFSVFLSLFNAFREQLAAPDLLLYLHRPLEVLLKNIRNRGRAYELNISYDYLNDIQSLYMEYLKSLNGLRVLILRLEDHDFFDGQLFEEIVGLCTEKHDAGVRIIEL